MRRRKTIERSPKATTRADRGPTKKPRKGKGKTSDSNKSPDGGCFICKKLHRAQEYPKNERLDALILEEEKKEKRESLTIAFLDSDGEVFCVTGPGPPRIRGRGSFWKELGDLYGYCGPRWCGGRVQCRSFH